MDDWKKICCAVDFSDPSRAAMQRAAELARRLEADLLLLHVYDAHAASPEILVSHFERALPEIEEKMQTWQREAERIAGRPARSMILTGNAAAEIVRLSREGLFDLLVLATRGRSGLVRLVLGSVADRAVRESECPVLVVRQPSEAESGGDRVRDLR